MSGNRSDRGDLALVEHFRRQGAGAEILTRLVAEFTRGEFGGDALAVGQCPLCSTSRILGFELIAHGRVTRHGRHHRGRLTGTETRDHQGGLANLDLGPDLERIGPDDLFAIESAAIGRAQIDQLPTLIDEFKGRMLATELEIEDPDLAPRASPEVVAATRFEVVGIHIAIRAPMLQLQDHYL